jgi:hypothetical protein
MLKVSRSEGSATPWGSAVAGLRRCDSNQKLVNRTYCCAFYLLNPQESLDCQLCITGERTWSL